VHLRRDVVHKWAQGEERRPKKWAPSYLSSSSLSKKAFKRFTEKKPANFAEENLFGEFFPAHLFSRSSPPFLKHICVVDVDVDEAEGRERCTISFLLLPFRRLPLGRRAKEGRLLPLSLPFELHQRPIAGRRQQGDGKGEEGLGRATLGRLLR